MELQDKVVLITGSSTGIGKETALALAKAGARVVVTYHATQQEGEEVQKECEKYSPALLIHLNVMDTKSIQESVDVVIAQFGRIDILINNAGCFVYKSLEKQTTEEIERQLQVNLGGTILMTSACLSYLKKQSDAVIINVASVLSKQSIVQGTVYCASKFGVRGFTQALALELPKNIRIYCVNPGLTATKMTGFQGIPASQAADVILATAQEQLGKKSGEDVDVRDFVPKKRSVEIKHKNDTFKQKR